MLSVVSVRKRVYGAKITVTASEDVVTKVNSPAGCRVFCVSKGQTLAVAVRGFKWTPGMTIDIDHLIDRSWEWLDLPWHWSTK